MTKNKFDLTPIARAIWEDRYGLKDESGKLVEKDILDTFRRTSKAVASKEKDPKKWENNFYELLSNKYFCPAGRILANAGTHFSQLLNCYVIPFKDDSLESIMETAKNMAITQKFGGGCGFNYSKIRPEGAHIKGVNGHSCGTLGFIDMMGVISGVIEQGGSRRGANLGLLEVWHPDVWDYMSFKNEHEWERLQEFMTVEDDEKWNYFKKNNAYKLQMYNISIGITNEFLKALKNDEMWAFTWGDTEWELYTVKYRKVGDKDYEKSFEVIADKEDTAKWKVRRCIPYPKSNDIFEVISKRKIKASEVWNKLCENAWANGCPGIINISEARRMHNGEYFNPIESTNPCITGDVKVAVADGRVAVPIKQLSDEGLDVPVYCRNDKGGVSVRMMRHPRITGYNEELVEVKITGGHSVRVTPNHKIVLSSGLEKKAKDLVPGDSLSIMNKVASPFERVLRHSNSKSQKYYWVNNTDKKSWVLDHRLIYNFHNPKLGYKNVVHHKDKNGLNNVISNLDSMAKRSHDKLHAKDMVGDLNPMRRAQTEWSKEKWEDYHNTMSSAVSGELNGRYSGVSNKKLFNYAVERTKVLGRKMTSHEWEDYARKTGLPTQFSEFRVGVVIDFLDKAAIEAGVPGQGLKHANLREYHRFLRLKDQSDLDLFFESGAIKVRKTCEWCKQEFIVGYMEREQCYCSYSCSSKKRNSSPEIKEKTSLRKKKEGEDKKILQINTFNDYKLETGKIPMKKEFVGYCREKKIPFRIPSKREQAFIKNTFKSWGEFKEAALTHNHRVVSVEPCGREDVYNGTVDQYHNFYIGSFEETLDGDRILVYINNLQCGEQPLPAFGSCNLGSLVLPSFLSEDKKGINYDRLKKATHHAVRFLDNVTDNSDFPMPESKKVSQKERRIGVGTTGIHDLLISLKVPYDSEEGRKITEELLQFIRDEAYKYSVSLAKEKGPFPAFKADKYCASPYIQTLPESLQKSIREHGVRNVCVLSQAPVGSTGTMLNVSQGCEPWFSMAFERHTGFGSYIDGCSDFLEWNKVHEGEKKPDYFKTAPEISPEDHVKMMILFSKYIDSAVSKTVNLPNNATIKDVSKVFLMALDNGVKGITIFRDGCRVGVLKNLEKKEEKDEKDGVPAVQIEPIKVETKDTNGRKYRGNRTVGATSRIHMHNHNMYVTVNRNTEDGNVVEVFATVGESKKPGTHRTSGVEDSWAEGLGKIISLALRAGVTTDAVIRNLKNIPSDKPVFATLGDSAGSELVPSPPHAIARIIEEEMKYELSAPTIKSEDLSQKEGNCDDCGSSNIKWKSATCYDCLDCAYSGCG